MNIKIALIDSTKNKIIKTEIIESCYNEAEAIVKEKNNNMNTDKKYWTVLNINV